MRHPSARPLSSSAPAKISITRVVEWRRASLPTPHDEAAPTPSSPLSASEHATFLGAVNGGGSERAIVVVHAAALEFERLPVEPETVLSIHFNLPDSEMSRGLVQRFARRCDFDFR